MYIYEETDFEDICFFASKVTTETTKGIKINDINTRALDILKQAISGKL
ncbi:hypothetical protein [Desnuesiella massiliensis]|nr:hypothetical protein [Desnuesiella massiliensis]